MDNPEPAWAATLIQAETDTLLQIEMVSGFVYAGYYFQLSLRLPGCSTDTSFELREKTDDKSYPCC